MNNTQMENTINVINEMVESGIDIIDAAETVRDANNLTDADVNKAVYILRSRRAKAEQETRERENRERVMYGVTVEEMKADALFVNFDDANSLINHAMSIISDAQYMLEIRHDAEIARQWMNKAKWFLSEASRLTHPHRKLEADARAAEAKLAEAKAEAAEYNARRDRIF